MATIVEYEPCYREAFKSLNEEWITAYFEMEETDNKVLDDPEGFILRQGGHIFVALLDEKPVGTCALIKMAGGKHDFELAKMAVSPAAQGKSIGRKLGQRVVDKAKELGASSIYLESNSKLVPAIALYRKLGFKNIVGAASPYARCNVQMELILNEETANMH